MILPNKSLVLKKIQRHVKFNALPMASAPGTFFFHALIHFIPLVDNLHEN